MTGPKHDNLLLLALQRLISSKKCWHISPNT